MTLFTLVARSLRFHARSHLGAFLGAAVGTAVLVGALVVGDSVGWSLRLCAIVVRLELPSHALREPEQPVLESRRSRDEPTLLQSLNSLRASYSSPSYSLFAMIGPSVDSFHDSSLTSSDTLPRRVKRFVPGLY